ncbi:hypothetical protein ACJ72_08391, partial [Emergomyces africanus]
IILRLSKPDERDPSKRRHFEISIDSPFHIMSCLAAQSNLYLPAYSSPSQPQELNQNLACGCKNAADRNTRTPPSSSTFPPTPQPPTSPATTPTTPTTLTTNHNNNNNNNNHDRQTPTPRLIHLLRTPSFAPPSFEELTPPPPLPTPPPDYTSIVPDDVDDPRAGLHDYFERLHVAEREYEEGMRGRSSQVDVPLTPGGRVHRSMDIPRERVRVGVGVGVGGGGIVDDVNVNDG